MNYHYCFSNTALSHVIPFTRDPLLVHTDGPLTRASFLQVFFPVPVSSASRTTISHTSSSRLSTYSPLSLLNLLDIIFPFPFIVSLGEIRFLYRGTAPITTKYLQPQREGLNLGYSYETGEIITQTNHQHKPIYCELDHVLPNPCYCYGDISL